MMCRAFRVRTMLAMLIIGFGSPAFAQNPEALFDTGVAALREGRPADAIAEFEALADRGVRRSALSYNRGLAYVGRVRLGEGLPGDLGQAAHAFEEARSLGGEDSLVADSEKALVLVRSEVARRRAQAGTVVDLDEGVSLDGAVIGLLPENTWAAAAFVASCALGIALYLRRRTTDAHVGLGATVTIVVSAVAVLALTVIVVRARDVRLHERMGIIVAPSAHLSDERRVVLPGVQVIPEGARVRTGSSQGGWIQVQWGKLSGWLPVPTVRPLASP